MNQDLQNYIKEMHEQGFSDERVREELIKAGWTQERIDTEIKAFGQISSMPPATLEEETPKPEKTSDKKIPKKEPLNKKSKKKLILPLSIVIGVFLIVGVVFGALYSDIWNPGWDPFGGDNQIKKANELQGGLKGAEENIDTPDQYDYINEEFGFALNYPKQELEAIDETNNYYLFCLIAKDEYFDKWEVFYDELCTIGVRVIFFPEYAQGLGEYVSANRNWRNNIAFSETIETIAETQWVKQKKPIRCDNKNQEICGFSRLYFTELKSENLALEIRHNNGGINDSDIMRSILESINIFEPIKNSSSSLNITDWTTHENKRFLYKFQYPKNWWIGNDMIFTSVFDKDGVVDDTYNEDIFVTRIYEGGKAEDVIDRYSSQVDFNNINDCTKPNFVTVVQNQGWVTDCVIFRDEYPKFKRYYAFQSPSYNASDFNFYTLTIHSPSPELADRVAESLEFIEDPSEQYVSECSEEFKPYALGGPYRQIEYGYWENEFVGQIDVAGEITTQENPYEHGLSINNVVLNISNQISGEAELESPFVLGYLDDYGKFTTVADISEEDRQFIEDNIDSREKVNLHLEIKIDNLEVETYACFIEVK